jgi:nicotinate-nucleotide adenylyltransferase
MASQNTDLQRLALFGGAFDPVHLGHMTIARYALKQVGLDRIIFIPTAQSPLKTRPPAVSDDARVEMLELATDGEQRFKVDTFEVEAGGVSYTIETVKHFREMYPNAELFWMIGADQFEQLDRWRDIEDLAESVTFLVFGRSGASLEPRSVKGLKYFEVDAPLMEASSSQIRERCQRGQGIGDLVSEEVEAFISERGLYTESK